MFNSNAALNEGRIMEGKVAQATVEVVSLD